MTNYDLSIPVNGKLHWPDERMKRWAFMHPGRVQIDFRVGESLLISYLAVLTFNTGHAIFDFGWGLSTSERPINFSDRRTNHILVGQFPADELEARLGNEFDILESTLLASELEAYATQAVAPLSEAFKASAQGEGFQRKRWLNLRKELATRVENKPAKIKDSKVR